MVQLEDLPPELRQQIILLSLPPKPTTEEPAPPHIQSLLLACQGLHEDTVQVLARWRPAITIREPNPEIIGPWFASTAKCKIQSLRLHLFATMHPEIYFYASVGHASDWVRLWINCVGTLPRVGVERVIVDFTTVPQWLLKKRPDFVQSYIVDRLRGLSFLRAILDTAVDLLERLHKHFSEQNIGSVPIEVCGQFWTKSRSRIQDIIDGARTRGVDPLFTGTYLTGKELPDSLSLGKTCERLGVTRTYRSKPGLHHDFTSLFPISWSRESNTVYYNNALEDEEGARDDLITVLKAAQRRRKPVSASNPTPGSTENRVDLSLEKVDFHRPPQRRKMLHRLCEDLGMPKISMGEGNKRCFRILGHTAD